MLGFKRHVISTEIGRLTIFISIYSVYRKITCMAGPFPIICIATKLTNAFRRNTYQANISVGFINIHQVLITFKHAVNFSIQPVFFIHYLIGNSLKNIWHFHYPCRPVKAFYRIFHFAGYINYFV